MDIFIINTRTNNYLKFDTEDIKWIIHDKAKVYALDKDNRKVFSSKEIKKTNSVLHMVLKDNTEYFFDDSYRIMFYQLNKFKKR